MIVEQNEYLVYTDGSCRQNIGGWGFVIFREGIRVCGYGGAINCTNNQVEMMAAIMALRCFRGDNNIIITTDSKYLRDGMKSYIYNWVRNKYRTAAGNPVKNRTIWEELYESQLDQAPEWEWVKGHSGDTYNEMADHLALQGRLYAEETKKRKKTRETSMHNFHNVTRAKKVSSGFFMHGKPKIYYEDVNG